MSLNGSFPSSDGSRISSPLSSAVLDGMSRRRSKMSSSSFSSFGSGLTSANVNCFCLATKKQEVNEMNDCHVLRGRRTRLLESAALCIDPLSGLHAPNVPEFQQKRLVLTACAKALQDIPQALQHLLQWGTALRRVLVFRSVLRRDDWKLKMEVKDGCAARKER